MLKREEEVLTRGDPRHRYNIGTQTHASLRTWVAGLPRFHEGGVAGGRRGVGPMGPGMDVRFELINQTSQPVRAVEGDTRIDTDSYIKQVFIRDVRDNGQVTQALAAALSRQRT